MRYIFYSLRILNTLSTIKLANMGDAEVEVPPVTYEELAAIEDEFEEIDLEMRMSTPSAS